MLKQPQILIVIYVIAMTTALFGIGKNFPTDWYRPTNLALLFGSVCAMVQIFNIYMFSIPIAIISAITAVIIRPERLLPRTAVLLLPLWPAVLATLWGAYCWRYYQRDSMGLKMGVWISTVFGELNSIYLLHFFVLFLAVLFSKTWHDARIFALCVLTTEFLLTIGTVWIASMATSGGWL